MLNELCKELNNWFVQKIYFDDYTIENGTLIVPELKAGQYFRIVGSVFNDGVYEYPATELEDETFNGAVWAMAVPKDVIALSSEIDDWKAKYAGVNSASMSPFQSESFGGYSYTKASGSDGTAAGASTWQNAFKSRLNQYRKVRAL